MNKITRERVYKTANFLTMVAYLSMQLDYNPLLEPVYILFAIYAPFSIIRTFREVMHKKSER